MSSRAVRTAAVLGVAPVRDAGARPASRFVLDARGTYRHLTGTKGSGRLRYHERTRALAFTGGPPSTGRRSAEYYDRPPDVPTIVPELPRGRREGDCQNCLFRGAAPR